MSTGKIIVVGVNGHVGRAAARAFAEAGWEVSGFGRSRPAGLEGVRFIQGDANDTDALRLAIADVDVVLNALNLPYDQWFHGRAEALLARVIEATGKSGRTLLFPGNIYNYSADQRRVTPDSPQNPERPRGEIRVRMENMLREAAARGDLRAVVLRAGDFYGPESSKDWFDQLILREAHKNRVALAAHDIPHSWAYLPDLARAFVKLAERRAELASFEVFHFAGHFVTAGQIFSAIEKQAGRKLKRVSTPWGMIRMMGLFMPVMREVAKMRYLFDNPMELQDARLDALLEPGLQTPFDEAVGRTVARYWREA